MKRWAVRISLLVLAGAIVNVLVAWSCAIWATISDSDITGKVAWPTPVPANWPRAQAVNHYWGHGISAEAADADSWRFNEEQKSIFNSGSERISYWAEVERFGLPFHTLQLEDVSISALTGVAIPQIQIGWFRRGIEVPNMGRLSNYSSHHLPLKPLPLGFVANSLFFAGAIALTWWAHRSVLRAIRRQRGQCEACAYPIGTGPVCTECGAAIEMREVPR